MKYFLAIMGYPIYKIKHSFKYIILICYSNALKIITVDGTVVYCTCSLSPIQNDGVVGMAMKKAWEETNSTWIVK